MQSLCHATIRKIDVSKALPGVHDVITYLDAPDKVELAEGQPSYEAVFASVHERKMFDRELRKVWDYVAAEDEDTAENALDQIEVEYDVLPAGFDAEEAIKPGAPQLYPSGNVIKGSVDRLSVQTHTGNVEEGLRKAHRVFERAYTVPFVNGTPMEPRGCVASWDIVHLTVWGGVQRPYMLHVS